MKASREWLEEYSDIDVDTIKLGDILTMTGSKVETIEQKGNNIKNVVVGKILEVTKHPDADKLLVSQINIGKETRQIVSGIADFYTPEEMVGKKVIVVTNLKPAKLRGVESQGMILAGSKKKMLELVSVENLPNGTKIR